MSNKQIGRINNKSVSPTSQEILEPKKEIVGRVSNELASPTNQQTSEPKEEMVGRVNNELDKNVGLETTSDEEKIGVVNNEIKHDQDTQVSKPQITVSVNNQLGQSVLPQVAETNTPRPMDAAGECSLYDEFMVGIMP